jgi:hypothetical protein
LAARKGGTRAEEQGEMAGTPRPLLCELHAHTTWSDGALSVPDLVDLYGSADFDVLAITDHLLRSPHDRPCVHAANYGSYLDEVETEASAPVPATACSFCRAWSSPTTTRSRRMPRTPRVEPLAATAELAA